MKLLQSQAGVTVLEGVIALGLLAVVTAGAFGVLASASRKSSQPDMREEMTLAVEKVKDWLQSTDSSSGKLCDTDETAGGPLALGEHNVKCMLPLICDQNSDSSNFVYNVSSQNIQDYHLPNSDLENTPVVRKVTFRITCNGYEL